MPTVCTLHHVACEQLGMLAQALQSAKLDVRSIQSHAGEPIPTRLDGIDGLIIMGGPMGVQDQDAYPFLRAELRLIEQALEKELPVLGVCLGSQLLATALGATVRPGKRKELGWHPLALTSEAGQDQLWQDVGSPFTAFHWHGDVFDLPRGAVHLAASRQTPCQAFRHGRNAYGLLFHMEVTAESVREIVTTFREEATATGADPDAILAETPRYLPGVQSIGRRVFQRWTRLVR